MSNVHKGMATWGERLVPLSDFRAATAQAGRALAPDERRSAVAEYLRPVEDPTPVEGPFGRIAVFGGVYSNRFSLEAVLEDARRRDMNRRQEAHETLHQGIARRERITADLGDLRRGESAAKEELQRATESLTTTENSLYLLREELAAKSSSLTATESMANSFDDAGWAELSGPKAAEAGVGGVIGPLADLLEIQPGYEKAIEAVLGNRLRATIVEGLA